MVSNLTWDEVVLGNLFMTEKDAAVSVLPLRGQQIWVYNSEGDQVREPVLVSIIRSVQKGDATDLRRWGKLKLVISEYKGFWTRLGITYTRMLMQTESRSYDVKVVRFKSNCLMFLKAADLYQDL